MLNPYITVAYPLQAWQYIMLVPLISCLLLLVASSVLAAMRGASPAEVSALPKWLVVSTGFGILMFAGMPTTVVIQYSFITLMSTFGAPTGSVVVMSMMVVGSWVMFFWSNFGQVGGRGVRT